MNFPDGDKFRRANEILKERGIDNPNLLEIADVYEQELGGSTFGREQYEEELAAQKGLTYYCPKCEKKHRRSSKIGKEHEKYEK